MECSGYGRTLSEQLVSQAERSGAAPQLTPRRAGAAAPTIPPPQLQLPSLVPRAHTDTLRLGQRLIGTEARQASRQHHTRSGTLILCKRRHKQHMLDTSYRS